MAQKTAFVTGSSSGIGKTTAITLAEAGYDIAVHYSSNKEGADDTACQIRALGRKTCVYKANIQSIQEIEEMFMKFDEDFDDIDLLVNNAGITRFTPILEATEELWNTVMNTDLRGAYFCTKEFVKRRVGKTGGVVINISSNHSKGNWPNAAIYAAGKAGMNKMTENLALELAPMGIRVVCVAPGYTWIEKYGDLPNARNGKITSKIPAQRFAATQEIADAVVFLSSDKAGYITGTTLTIDGGALLPVLAANDYT